MNKWKRFDDDSGYEKDQYYDWGNWQEDQWLDVMDYDDSTMLDPGLYLNLTWILDVYHDPFYTRLIKQFDNSYN